MNNQNDGMMRNSREESRVVFTIGHSTTNPCDLIKLLILNHIEVIIDVRSIPYSRVAPQFNKKALEAIMLDGGFDYRFGGKFLGAYPGGKRPEVRVRPDWKKLAERDEFKQGIDRVVQLATQKQTVLLCAEENPYRCHRHHLIAPALIAKGFRVIHIRHKEENQPVKLKDEPGKSQQTFLFNV